MEILEQIHVRATAAAIYAIYSDVPRWKSWDPSVVDSWINGPFSSGTMGVLRFRSGPDVRFTISDASIDQSFSVESSLPLCCLRFEHDLREADGLTLVTHRVSFRGPLSWFFQRIMARRLRSSLLGGLAGLRQTFELVL
jgi:hypothetical protein